MENKKRLELIRACHAKWKLKNSLDAVNVADDDCGSELTQLLCNIGIDYK